MGFQVLSPITSSAFKSASASEEFGVSPFGRDICTTSITQAEILHGVLLPGGKRRKAFE